MTERKVYSAKELATDGFMAVMLFLTGMFKIPSFIPGAEFQLSAPFAVSIAKNLGFKRYLIIGVAASLCGFLLGVQNMMNITVAMVYRIVVGILLALFRESRFVLVISGPCGTLVSRIVLAALMGTSVWMLILYALPGMIFTAVLAPVLVKAERRLLLT